MKIDVINSNPALISIFKRPDQVITLDANFLIPPDRSRYGVRSFDFNSFQKVWLFTVFSNLAIHEAVFDELILPSVHSYIKLMIDEIPPRLDIHKDSTLTTVERVLRDSIEARIFPLTNYNPI